MYVLAALILGSFVSIYNYLAFRMQGAPFFLPHEILASLYLMYLAGSAGSMSAGVLSDKFSSGKVLPAMVSLSIAGLLFMLTSSIVCVVIGLGIFTISFFGAHTTASRIVAQYSSKGSSVSISLYLLFYYAGSSFLGSGTGIIMHNHGWAAFIFTLCAICILSLILALTPLRKIARG